MRRTSGVPPIDLTSGLPGQRLGALHHFGVAKGAGDEESVLKPGREAGSIEKILLGLCGIAVFEKRLQSG